MKISVLISIYSEPTEWIREALDSVLNQTFQDFEIVLINDNPSRIENDLIVEEYEKKFKLFKYIKNEVNIGLTKSLNKGLKLCEGEYIARMDADDICFSTRFEKQVEFMDLNRELVVCGSYVETFGTSKNVWRFPTIKHDIKDYFFIANPLSTPLAHPSVMLRRSSLIKHNIEYNESYLRGQDFRLWYDILNIGDISNVPEILLKYRLSKSQIGAKYARDQNLIRIKIYLEYVNKLMKSDYDTLSKGLYEELKKNKRIIIDKISKNHYDSLIVFFLCNTTETLKRNFLFSLECSMFFNFNIRLKEKVKCILNIINFKI